MNEHPNAKLAKRIWLAASTGDVEALSDLVADDVVWHSVGRTPWSGMHRGRDAVLAFLASIGSSAEIFNSDLRDVLANDERAILLARMTGRRGHKKLDVGYVLIYEIGEGRVQEIRAIPFDPVAVDEFWG
ncbi:MAG: nuclear transport factor 2 family protein [Deltaproteobacteria bacterium]|nr:MAG: nuclear transport factor 2 family protein [Deltaproteobacteria bacterium]